MPDFIKVGNGIFVNLAKRIGYFSMTVPFGASYSVKQPSAEVIAQMTAAALAKKNLQAGDADGADAGAGFDQVQPKDSDYIYPLFRALDAGLIEDYWIDFSKPGVLKKSMPLLLNQSIFLDHGKQTSWWGGRSVQANDWVGVVNQVFWDEKGEQAGGIPGINNELKIDWTQDIKLGRGLLMRPPAIKAVSVSPFFSWDPSHDELWNTETFWRNLGQKIEGGIKTPAVPEGDVVRLVVGEVVDYLEESFVVKGANAGSNRQIDPDGGDEELSALRARLGEALQERGIVLSSATLEELQLAAKPTAESTELDSRPEAGDNNQLGENMKIKLTAAQKKALGFENEQGDEFEADVVLAAMLTQTAALEQRATAAEATVALQQPFIEAERAEVVRLATLVEGVTGTDNAVTLPTVFADSIKNATPAQLADWKTTYQQRVDAKFAPKCQKCGSTEVSRRSSVENASQEQTAPKRIPRSRL